MLLKNIIICMGHFLRFDRIHPRQL